MNEPPPDPSPYLTLKLAHQLFHKAPEVLDAEERRRVATVAGRQRTIERSILATAEAAGVVLPEAVVVHALAEVRGRYASDADYESDLARSGLDHERLREAIARDLKVEAVLEQVAGRASAVSDTEVEIFYLQHANRFRTPETRTLRHILLTIDETSASGGRAAVHARIEAIRARLEREPARFAEQALKHSECPTAMNGGLLGEVPRGVLYAEIEAVAFGLAAGELSNIVESPLGFHIVLCEHIAAERTVPLAQARERIRDHLEQVRRAAFQKSWVSALTKSG